MITLLTILATVLSMAVGTMQFGSQRLGGVALAAATSVPQDFRNLPEGPIETIFLNVGFSIKNAADASSTLVIDTGESAAAEGTDDCDLILNAMFSSWSLYWTGEDYCGTLSPAQWRTIFGYLNQRDFSGTLVNGAAIPKSSGSAQAYTVMVPIPVSLARCFKDGGMFRNGNQRLKTGQIMYNCGTAAAQASLTLANVTVAITAPTVSLTAETGAGMSTDVGPLWRVTRSATLPTVYDHAPATRILLADVTPASTSTIATALVGENVNVTPSYFAAKYRAERGATYYDVCTRCTPFIWIEPQRTLSDFTAHLGRSIHHDVSTVSSITMYDVQVMFPSAGEIERVGLIAGGGGNVQEQRPTPPSFEGRIIPAHLSPLVQHRFIPVGPSGGSLPSTVGARAQNAQVASRASLLQRRLTGRG